MNLKSLHLNNIHIPTGNPKQIRKISFCCTPITIPIIHHDKYINNLRPLQNFD